MQGLALLDLSHVPVCIRASVEGFYTYLVGDTLDEVSLHKSFGNKVLFIIIVADYTIHAWVISEHMLGF